jgi:hypothetical protein
VWPPHTARESTDVSERTSSGLSAFCDCRIMVLPEPRSPTTENLTPSFEHEILTVSPTICRSRVMRWNSDAGILMVAVYSVSGMPRCSLSIAISRSSKSEMRSWLGLSNMKVRESESSSVLRVIMSSLPEHLRIFAIDSSLMPKARVRSTHSHIPHGVKMVGSERARGIPGAPVCGRSQGQCGRSQGRRGSRQIDSV